jgi:hypothetical protein
LFEMAPLDSVPSLPDYVDLTRWNQRSDLGALVHEAVTSFDIDWYVVHQNAAEIVALVDHFAGTAGKEAWGDPAKRHGLHIEASRRLANFVSSGRALLDHAERWDQRLMRTLRSLVDINARVTRDTWAAPSHQVIRALCDATLHVAHQNSTLTLSIDPADGSSVRRIRFDLTPLCGDLERGTQTARRPSYFAVKK